MKANLFFAVALFSIFSVGQPTAAAVANCDLVTGPIDGTYVQRGFVNGIQNGGPGIILKIRKHGCTLNVSVDTLNAVYKFGEFETKRSHSGIWQIDLAHDNTTSIPEQFKQANPESARSMQMYTKVLPSHQSDRFSIQIIVTSDHDFSGLRMKIENTAQFDFISFEAPSPRYSLGGPTKEAVIVNRGGVTTAILSSDDGVLRSVIASGLNVILGKLRVPINHIFQADKLQFYRD
jgi:hypothetical protein